MVENGFTLNSTQVGNMNDIGFTWYGLGNSYNARTVNDFVFWNSRDSDDNQYINNAISQY